MISFLSYSNLTLMLLSYFFFFFFNDTATTEIYTFPYTTLFRSAGGEHAPRCAARPRTRAVRRCQDRKSTRLNSSHRTISYAVFCLKKKKYTAVLIQTIKKPILRLVNHRSTIYS